MKEFVSIFSKFGEIFSAKIPENLDTHEQKGFGFIAYKEEASQQRAIMEMDGTVLGNHIIGVQAASQESFFTKDTGYITNATLDNPEALVDEFDSSMPDAHYEAKYKSRPIDLSKLLTVKVDNLGPNIS